MTEEKPSCSTCAYRGACNKKYNIIDPSKCTSYTKDLTIDSSEETAENKKKKED